MSFFTVRPEIQEIIDMDVTDTKLLESKGYKAYNYYCGPWSLMGCITRIRNFLKSLGINFPFNRACFLHDMGYALQPSLYEKYLLDSKFKSNMKVLLKLKNYANEIEKSLKLRINLYHIFVLICTPLYLFQGKVKVQ